MMKKSMMYMIGTIIGIIVLFYEPVGSLESYIGAVVTGGGIVGLLNNLKH